MTSSELRDAFKYLFPEELEVLKEFSRCLYDEERPVIINIGAGAGTSALAFLESNPLVRVYSIDIQKEDSPLGCLYAELAAVEAASPLFWFRLNQFHGDSKEIGKHWQDKGTPDNPYPFYGLANIVFIDGDHSYEGCRGDIEAWLPNLRSGGLLLIHDYNKEEVIAAMDYDPATMPHYKEWPGVNQAVDELRMDSRVEFVETVDTLAIFRKVKL